ncbi:unnamed protein product (macronuclear) [Paramecium tetraurelia]|uniref:Transmembrane protein n=1 Tax=Paramecium tetraurelia TaxID=5888 RepID=A0DBQ6_PARTE|nr:uncharacterized protein GSPATT00015370001 [Paramecium tetraurelia]CAK80473.1 unnamed protein product [Paramecium tetraurelia]|eukprot:XP_001447870.1 hypothetical protein (macronuclear) [Paramecium tetraurelia strain d4-2]
MISSLELWIMSEKTSDQKPPINIIQIQQNPNFVSSLQLSHSQKMDSFIQDQAIIHLINKKPINLFSQKPSLMISNNHKCLKPITKLCQYFIDNLYNLILFLLLKKLLIDQNPDTNQPTEEYYD